MGYTLKPKNKNLDFFEFGMFSFQLIMERCIGLVIGYGKGLEPNTYIYSSKESGRGTDPISDDGYYVKSKDAKIMGRLTSSFVVLQKQLNDDFNLWLRPTGIIMPYERELLNRPIRTDFIEKYELFAEWAIKCNGFWIY